MAGKAIADDQTLLRNGKTLDVNIKFCQAAKYYWSKDKDSVTGDSQWRDQAFSFWALP